MYPEALAEVASAKDEEKLSHTLGEKVTALEGTGSATTQRNGVIVEIDYDSRSYVVLCVIEGYKNGYNMLVPFEEASVRINVPVTSGKRKRKINSRLLDL